MTIPLCKSQLLALDDQSDPRGDDDKFPAEQGTILIPLAHDYITDIAAPRRSQYELQTSVYGKG